MYHRNSTPPAATTATKVPKHQPAWITHTINIKDLPIHRQSESTNLDSKYISLAKPYHAPRTTRLQTKRAAQAPLNLSMDHHTPSTLRIHLLSTSNHPPSSNTTETVVVPMSEHDLQFDEYPISKYYVEFEHP